MFSCMIQRLIEGIEVADRTAHFDVVKTVCI